MKLIVWMIQENFQDAESVHGGHSHVTRQTAFFQPHPVPGGMQSHSFGMLSSKDGPFKYLEHAWQIGKRFCRSSCRSFCEIACWKTRFETEVCTCSQIPTEAVLWMVDSVDDLKSSFSVRGIRAPDK